MKKDNKDTSSNRLTLDNIINDALKNLKSIIDTNTVIGKEVTTTDGTVIIPISKIIVGFVAGGGESVKPHTHHNKSTTDGYPFSGASGAGFTVVPIGFLCGKKGSMEFVSVKSDTKYDELINLTNRSLKLILDNFTTKTNKG